MTIYKNVLKTYLTEKSYKEFFKKAMKKFNIKSIKDLKTDKEKKEFFNWIELNWTGEKGD